LFRIANTSFHEPNITTLGGDCVVTIGVYPPEKENSTTTLIGIILGVVLGVFSVLAIVLVFFLRKYRGRVDLSALPAEIRVFYEYYVQNSSSWDKEGMHINPFSSLTEFYRSFYSEVSSGGFRI
jgi:hypothetical protein